MHTDLAIAVDGVARIQECIPEKLERKRALFDRLGLITPEHTILSSSTSAYTPSEIAEALLACLLADASLWDIQGIRPTCFQSSKSSHRRSRRPKWVSVLHSFMHRSPTHCCRPHRVSISVTFDLKRANAGA